MELQTTDNESLPRSASNGRVNCSSTSKIISSVSKMNDQEKLSSLDTMEDAIWREITSYNSGFDEPVILSCLPKPDHFRICISPDGCRERTLTDHDQHFRKRLPGYPLQLIQLNQFPTFEFTSPGQSVTSAGSQSTLGLYLKTQDDRKLALFTGHGRTIGDEVRSIQPNREFRGVVEFVLQDSDPFCDVTVVRVIGNVRHSNHVVDDTGYCYHLNPVVEDVVHNQVLNVQLFSSGHVWRRRLKLANLMVWGSYSFLRASMAVFDVHIQQAIHKPGQSGVLLTTSEEEDQAHVVSGLLLLTGIYSPGDGSTWSLGQPLNQILERLQQIDKYRSLHIPEHRPCTRNNCAP